MRSPSPAWEGRVGAAGGWGPGPPWAGRRSASPRTPGSGAWGPRPGRMSAGEMDGGSRGVEGGVPGTGWGARCAWEGIVASSAARRRHVKPSLSDDQLAALSPTGARLLSEAVL